ncbi:MAG TPA: DUF2071 domain-containing protein [Chitinophagaceae bacterium]
MTNTFLQAEWRKLAMANYSVDISRLKKYLPCKTEIDLWNGTCYVSLVGFLFKNTKVKGLRIPFHINFEEVNLRFYVRYYDNGGWKRGVVFIKEIVSKPALTFVANRVYKEKYETMPTSHSWTTSADTLTAEYKWKKKQWNSLTINADKIPTPVVTGSEEEFITKHYWGYTKITDSKTSEYGVEHPGWEVYPIKSYQIDVDFEDIYGHDFSFLKTEMPKSVFLAEGSIITVKNGRTI